jgi:hypothetical protein
MEAILDFWRGCQNLSIIQWWGGGGRVCEGEEMKRRSAALVIAFDGWREGGGGRERGSKCVLVLNAPICI